MANHELSLLNGENDTTAFYITIDGDGVCGKEVLFGSRVRLRFHFPPIIPFVPDLFFGVSTTPYGLFFAGITESGWYKMVQPPFEKEVLDFSFVAPTEKEWGNSLTPGFVLSCDLGGCFVYQEFVAVRFVSELSSLEKPHVQKIGIDLVGQLRNIADRYFSGED